MLSLLCSLSSSFIRLKCTICKLNFAETLEDDVRCPQTVRSVTWTRTLSAAGAGGGQAGGGGGGGGQGGVGQSHLGQVHGEPHK